MSKRGNGEGSLFERAADKRWCAVYSLPDGRRKTLVAKTRAEAFKRLTEALQARQDGTLVTAPNQSVASFLNMWLEQVVKPSRRQGTYRGYEQLVRVHLVPTLGKTRLDKLAPPQVQALLNQKIDEGLSPRTVQYLRAVLRSALNEAIRWNLLRRNVAAAVGSPKVERAEFQPFGPEEARRLLVAAKGDRLEALFTVAIAMGLRQGEALGLTWDDVDLEAGRIHVRKQLQRVGGKLQRVELKTSSGRRTLTLPNLIVTALRDHRQRQLAAGIAPTGFVFTATNGSPLDARNVVRSYKVLLGNAGLPDRRFHDLRHSAATLMLVQGVPARVVQAILGHSKIDITLGLYSHAIPELHQDAADRMDALLGG